MRNRLPDRIEKGRINTGFYATGYGEPCGMFVVVAPTGAALRIVASDGDADEWAATGLPGPPFEHVSVSLPDRCPTWDEMAWVKSLFWGDDECVVQYHPPASEYVNNHKFCLHLWKPVGAEVPLPPSLCVGLKGVTL